MQDWSASRQQFRPSESPCRQLRPVQHCDELEQLMPCPVHDDPGHSEPMNAQLCMNPGHVSSAAPSLSPDLQSPMPAEWHQPQAL